MKEAWAQFRTRQEILYDDHVGAHDAGECFEECLVCRELEDMVNYTNEQLDKEEQNGRKTK